MFKLEQCKFYAKGYCRKSNDLCPFGHYGPINTSNTNNLKILTDLKSTSNSCIVNSKKSEKEKSNDQLSSKIVSSHIEIKESFNKSPNLSSNKRKRSFSKSPIRERFQEKESLFESNDNQLTDESTNTSSYFISSFDSSDSIKNDSPNKKSSFKFIDHRNLKDKKKSSKPIIEPELSTNDAELIKEFNSNDFSLLGEIDEETKRKKGFEIWLWQKEVN